MACDGNVLFIKNPLWNEEAELGEADYESDLGREVGDFDSYALFQSYHVKNPDFSVAVVRIVGLAQPGFAIPQRVLYFVDIVNACHLAVHFLGKSVYYLRRVKNKS